MTSLTFSDLSQMFQLRRDTVRVRQDLATATQELSSGRHADLGRAVSGNYGPLVAIDRQLSALDAFDTNAKEATLFAEAAQMSLSRISDLGNDFGSRMATLMPNDAAMQRAVFANEAAQAFKASVAALNTSAAGRSVFAGTATNGAALASADDMLADLSDAVDGLTTAQDVIDRVNAWFAPGNEFDTSGYVGSTSELSGYRVAEGQEVRASARADDDVFREHLKGFALGALLDSPDITDADELAALAGEAGTRLLSNHINLVAVQASIGSAQHRVEDAMARNGSERTSLRMARSEIVAVDPYKVATDLQNLQSQLETIYTITARLSGLSLTNYLR